MDKKCFHRVDVSVEVSGVYLVKASCEAEAIAIAQERLLEDECEVLNSDNFTYRKREVQAL